MAIDISYGGFDLQTDNIITSQVDHDKAPPKKVTKYNRARAHGSKRTSAFYTDRVIRATGKIAGSGSTDLDARIDALKAALGTDGQNLDIDYNGGIRRYVADVDQLVVTRLPGATGATFQIEFGVPDGFGRSTAATVIGSGTVTSAVQSIALTVAGSFREQRPTITATLTDITGTGINTIGLMNNGVGISITRTWADGDVVVIDTEELEVTVNGLPHDYAGNFPTWPAGAGDIDWTDDFTARSVDVSVSNTSRWL